MIGSNIAMQIQRLKEGNIRKLEEGPVGGSFFHFGTDIVGYAMNAPVPENRSWNLTRIKDGALAQFAYQLADCGLVWLPGITKIKATIVSMASISMIGQFGPVHRDINGNTSDGGIRGHLR